MPHDIPSRSSALIEHIAALRLSDLPPAVVARAKLALLDSIGEALACSRLAHAPVQRLAAFVGTAEKGASLIGQGGRAAPADAALFNAALATFGLTDSLHGPTTIHAPAIMAAAALAAAEHGGVGGAACLEGFVLGTEVACRVSAALNPDALYARGFHPTGICGTFGAAVAAGRVLGFTRAEMRAALGLAFQQASGCLAWTTDATESARPLSPGFAARGGVTAALLAARGLVGPPEPFDGKYSVFAAFSDDPRPDALLDGWAERYAIAELTHKLHASCTYTHAMIDAVVPLATENGVAPTDIDRLILAAPPPALPMITEPGLRSCYAAYVVAVSLVSGRIVIDDIVGDRTADGAVEALVARISVVGDPSLAEGAARVDMITKAGMRLSRRTDAAKGTPGNPASAAEMRTKFDRAAHEAGFGGAAAAIVALVEGIERAERVDALCDALRGAG